MTRNKSLFLLGVFFLIVIIFGNVFWRMFSQSSSEELEKIKQEAVANLSKNQVASMSSAAPNTAGASTKAAAEAAPADTQNSDPAAKAIDTTLEKVQDEMTDWKTYADEKSRFEFKYPTDAQVVPNGDLYRVSQNDKTWKFRIYSNKDKADLQTWYSGEFSDKERLNCTLSDSATLKVGSYETKYVNPNSGATECGKAGYFSLSTDKKKVIRVENGEETVENVNKLLATFKFLTE